MRRILITGASGTVGRHLLDCLVHKPEPLELIALSRSAKKGAQINAQWSSPKRLPQWVVGDLTQPDSLHQLFFDSQTRPFDYVIHLAARLGLRNGPEYEVNNVEATKNLIDGLCQQSSVLSRLVFVSSIAAIDRGPLPRHLTHFTPLTIDSPATPTTDYGKTKLAAEHVVMESGFPYTILRPAFIFGRYVREGSTVHRALMGCVKRNPLVRYPFPGQLSGIAADDLADLLWASCLSAACQNQVYYAADPHVIAVQSVFAQINQQLGNPATPYPIPNWCHRLVFDQCLRHGMSKLLAHLLFSHSFTCDSQLIWRDTRLTPYYGSLGGVTQMVKWFETTTEP